MSNLTERGGDEPPIFGEVRRFLAGMVWEEDHPTPPDIAELEREVAIANAQEQLNEMLPALIEISQLLARVRMPKQKRDRLQRALMSASRHLYLNFEHMRRMSRDEE